MIDIYTVEGNQTFGEMVNKNATSPRPGGLASAIARERSSPSPSVRCQKGRFTGR